VPLSSEQVQRIGETLTARMGTPVIPEVAVDPKLIAGMVCRVGELTFDSTLKNQLGLMAERLDTRRH
jgi:F-type H+-transporting ATPase subunit delta